MRVGYSPVCEKNSLARAHTQPYSQTFSNIFQDSLYSSLLLVVAVQHHYIRKTFTLIPSPKLCLIVHVTQL